MFPGSFSWTFSASSLLLYDSEPDIFGLWTKQKDIGHFFAPFSDILSNE